MRISHPAIGYSQNERLLVGIRSESFQFIFGYLATNVAQTEIGDAIVRILPLQQTRRSQDLRTTASVITTNRYVQSRCSSRTEKRSSIVLAVKAEKRSISGMKPRGGGKHGIIGSGRHTLTISACVIWIYLSRSQIYNTRDKLMKIGIDCSHKHWSSSRRRRPSGIQSDRTRPDDPVQRCTAQRTHMRSYPPA